MEATTLSAALRTETGKCPNHRLRAQGLVPATVYGLDLEPMNVSVRAKDLAGIIQSTRGVNTIIALEAEGAPRQEVIIRDFQIHPLRRKLVHCDFLRVKADQMVVVTVPLATVGKAAAEKLGGRIRILSREMKVTCLGKDIPDRIVYDVTALATGRTVYAAEVPLPEGVNPGWRHNFPVLAVAAPKAAEVEEEAAGAA